MQVFSFLDTLLEGTRTFSYDLITSVASEFRVLFPQLDEVMLEFGSAPRNMEWLTFVQLANRAIEKHSNAIEQWIGIETPDPKAIARVLFQAGVVGITRPGGETHYRNGRTFDTNWRMAGEFPDISIHAAFDHALDTKPIEDALIVE